MKKKDYKRLGDFIEPVDERNTDNSISLSQGISNNKYFQTPRQVAVNTANDKIVRHGYFAYNKATTRNGDKISIAYREGADCTVSSAYQIFRITNEDLLNPYFLWMWFKRPEFDRYARFKSHGSAHEFFEFEEMCEVYLPVPPIEEQRKIVSDYETLTHRIKLNELMIQKLEDTAQVLYRKMFVDDIDFENLPEGFEHGILQDLGEIVGGSTPSTNIKDFWTNNGISWISPADLSKQSTKFISKGSKDITKEGYNSCSTKLLPAGSILFSSRAPIGLMAITTNSLCTNQGFKSIIPKEKYGSEYVYYHILSLKDKIAQENEGSTFSEVNGKSMSIVPVIIPSEKTCKEFTHLIKPIHANQEILDQENSILKQMRSYLLSFLAN